jgi:hypothetical protein
MDDGLLLDSLSGLTVRYYCMTASLDGRRRREGGETTGSDCLTCQPCSSSRCPAGLGWPWAAGVKTCSGQMCLAGWTLCVVVESAVLCRYDALVGRNTWL